MQGSECLEIITETFLTLICDLLAAVRKLTTSYHRNSSQTTIEIDGLKAAECLETITETLQTFVCDVPARAKIRYRKCAKI